MKRLLRAGFALFLGSIVWSADPLASRPDLYGPAPSQWNYTTKVSTAVVSTVPGLLGLVIIPATCAETIKVYDSTTTTASFLIGIATMTATAGLSYNFTGLRTTYGLTVGVPAACTSGAVVTYR